MRVSGWEAQNCARCQHRTGKGAETLLECSAANEGFEGVRAVVANTGNGRWKPGRWDSHANEKNGYRMAEVEECLFCDHLAAVEHLGSRGAAQGRHSQTLNRHNLCDNNSPKYSTG